MFLIKFEHLKKKVLLIFLCFVVDFFFNWTAYACTKAPFYEIQKFYVTSTKREKDKKQKLTHWIETDHFRSLISFVSFLNLMFFLFFCVYAVQIHFSFIMGETFKIRAITIFLFLVAMSAQYHLSVISVFFSSCFVILRSFLYVLFGGIEKKTTFPC